jgi:hypothetical protein
MTKRCRLAEEKKSGPAFGRKKTKWLPKYGRNLAFSDRKLEKKRPRDDRLNVGLYDFRWGTVHWKIQTI